MNKAVLSFWEKFRFRCNINKIRKSIMEYLTNEGIENKLVKGSIQVTYEDYKYAVDFNLDKEYPCCNITFEIADEDYQALELSDKTFIADKVNTEEEHHSVVKCYNDSISVETRFYFTDKKMLLTLFYTHFTDLKSTVDHMLDVTLDKLHEKEAKKPIGFTISQSNIHSQEDRTTAQHAE